MLTDFRLEVFAAVAEEGSFTKASLRLGISQPAVSQNIAELEKTLGVQLFERARGSVRLTSDGRRFNEYAVQIMYWYKAAREAFADNVPQVLKQSAEARVPFRIAISDIYDCHLLPPGSPDADVEISGPADTPRVSVLQKRSDFWQGGE